MRALVTSIGLATALAAFGPVQAQEADALAPVTFETITSRMGVCVNFVIFRDPARIADVDPALLGGQERTDVPWGDVDAVFARAFHTQISGGSFRTTIRFLSYLDEGRSRSEVICEISFWELSDDDALRAANVAVNTLSQQFPVVRPMRQVSRSNRIGFCTPQERPLYVIINYDDDGEVLGLEMRDIMPGPFTAGTPQCDPEAETE